MTNPPPVLTVKQLIQLLQSLPKECEDVEVLCGFDDNCLYSEIVGLESTNYNSPYPMMNRVLLKGGKSRG